MKVTKITKPELEGDTYLITQAVNHMDTRWGRRLDLVIKKSRTRGARIAITMMEKYTQSVFYAIRKKVNNDLYREESI